MWYLIYKNSISDQEQDPEYKQIHLGSDSRNHMNNIKYQPHVGDTLTIQEANSRNYHSGIIKKVHFDFVTQSVSIFMISS